MEIHCFCFGNRTSVAVIISSSISNKYNKYFVKYYFPLMFSHLSIILYNCNGSFPQGCRGQIVLGVKCTVGVQGIKAQVIPQYVNSHTFAFWLLKKDSDYSATEIQINQVHSILSQSLAL